MAGLNSWLSPEILHALGWALIHSLWQCLAIAAAAAVMMALARRPSIRYLVGVGALAAMLAAPVATFFVLMAAPVHAVPAPGSGSPAIARAITSQVPASVPPHVMPAIDDNGVERGPWSVRLVREESRFSAMNLLPWLVAAWLCGVAFFSLRLAGGFLLLEHKRRNQSTVPNTAILTLCREVQRQLGLDRAIGYLECNWLETPAVIGWLRPAVLLPITALTGLSEAQLRAVIAHELAHIRRFDLLVNLFQALVETLLFYHPAMWWLSKRIRAERELCCDEIAIAASGNRLEYARALTLMASWESAPRLAMAANRGPLSDRIFHILGRKSASAGQRMLGMTGSVLFLIAALAAANALFDIAAPPIAQARESVKAALFASQTRVAHLAQQVFRPNEPAAQALSQGQRNVSFASTTTPDQRETLKDAQDQKLIPPAVNLSGLPPIESPSTPTVLAFNPAAPPVPSATAAPAPAAAGSNAIASGPKTEAGIRCLLGLGPDGCWRRLERPPLRGVVTNNCWTSQAWSGECPSGPLESIEYLGTNASSDDVYSVKFMHENATYILRPPGPDGKIERVWLTSTRSLAGTVTSPADQARIIYTRSVDRSGQESRQGNDQASAKPSAAETQYMPNTPTGAGDPDAVVCRAPQQIPGSGQLGPQVCLQNSEWWKVAMNGKDIGPDGKSLIDRPTVKYPAGEGDPDAVTCRTPQILDSGATIARYGPVVCRPNRFWADLIKNRQIVDKHGVIVKLPRGVDYGPSYGPGGYPLSPGDPYDSGHIQSGQPLPGTR